MPDLTLADKLRDEDAAAIATSSYVDWSKIDGRTVLVAGAAGYVPQFFVHAFLKRNDMVDSKIKVLAMCRNKEKAAVRFGGYFSRPDFQLVLQDVREHLNVYEPVNIYIDAASPAGIRSRHYDPAATFTANALGCWRLLDAARASEEICEGFLFLSSVDVYGSMADNRRLEEKDVGTLDTLNVRNAYSNGKRAAEAMCAAYQASYGVPVSIVRPFQILGPGLALDDGRLHVDFISQMLSSNKIVLKSDGTAKRTFLYIADAVAGMLCALTRGNAGEAYNVCDEQGDRTVKELAETMAGLVKDRKVEVVFDYTKRDTIEVKGALSVVVGSSEKLRGLGWRSELTLEDGLRHMMLHYGLNV